MAEQSYSFRLYAPNFYVVMAKLKLLLFTWIWVKKLTKTSPRWDGGQVCWLIRWFFKKKYIYILYLMNQKLFLCFALSLKMWLRTTERFFVTVQRDRDRQQHVQHVLLVIRPVFPFQSPSESQKSPPTPQLPQTVDADSGNRDRLACGAERLIALPRAQLVQAQSACWWSITYLFCSVV